MERHVGQALMAAVGIMVIVCEMQGSVGIRFVIDRGECFSHSVQYEVIDVQSYMAMVTVMIALLGEAQHRISFKVQRTYRFTGTAAYDNIKGPSNEQIHDIRDKTSEKYEFVVQHKGIYRFCFTNKSPYHETIDFDVHVGHFAYYDQHAKDEHFSPLLEQIAKLEEALYNIQFEQHWLEAQTDRQAIVNEGMSRRAVHKVMFESAALIGASVLQVCLLQRLFERKLGTSRV
ncbi:hypothetical protein TIFTF001_001716 [Ficus carica]|uniref:GOLD domain-containing protein n=1 Tax=Ficus carica TaxID=3494 RepID=A0AA88D5G9_FICCA|nr:hypothetical protein TIFTF001_001716 [Ficus carica]